VSSRLLAEDGARFSAIVKRSSIGPQASYRVTLDAGGRCMVDSDLRSFKTYTEAINWLALEADRRGFTRWQCAQE
jgi:hypothetical protein